MASTKPTCVITSRVSGPCEKCGHRGDPSEPSAAHLILASDDVTDKRPPELLCPRCCPVHGIGAQYTHRDQERGLESFRTPSRDPTHRTKTHSALKRAHSQPEAFYGF